MSQSFNIECEFITDKGIVRSHNEDFIDVSTAKELYILADGMGGHNAGEVASALAVGYILDAYNQDAKNLEPEEVKQDLSNSIISANMAVFKAQQSAEEYAGMGTTLVAAAIKNTLLYIAHVGDSRAYCVRDSNIKQLTKDHTLLQELIDRGYYTQQEAATAPHKNLVTRALGTTEDLKVDIKKIQMQDNDIYLLCSDGLTDMINEQDICTTINNFSDNLKQAAMSLIASANKNGGHDNVSVLLLKCSKVNKQTKFLGFIKKVTQILGKSQ